MSSGCDYKEVYRFPIPSPLVCTLFCPTFCSFFKCFSFLFLYILVIYLTFFLHSINKHTGEYGHPTEAV